MVLQACAPCPAERPKFDGTKCISCPTPSFWNFSLNDCSNCTGGRVYNYQRAECVCPNENTFYNGSKCIECYHPKYFDYETLECKSCPKNQIYDLNSRRCVDCPADRPVFNG